MDDAQIFLYLNGELDGDEILQVESWIESYPDEFERHKQIWEAAKTNTEKYQPNKKAAWKKLADELQPGSKIMKQRTISIGQRLLRYAAAAILVIGLGVFGYYLTSNQNQPEWTSFSSPKDSVLDVRLPDGSLITLNSNSSLQYNKSGFADARQVHLQGEAFFDVKRNPQAPFVINAANTKVKVLGTSFNVNSSDSARQVVVTVATGKVSFYSDKEDIENKLILKAGDVGLYSEQTKAFQQYKNTDLNFLAWKTKVFVFRGEELSEVIDVLGEYYYTKISIADKSLEKLQLTAHFDNKTLKQILHSIDAALDVRHKYTDDGVVLYGK